MAEAKRIEDQRIQFAQDTANYKDRLIAVLIEYATLDNFEVYKGLNATYVLLKDRENDYSRDWNEHRIALVPTVYNDLYELENAETEVRKYHDKVAEAARIEAIRQRGIAKLDEEERKAMGIKV